MQDKTGTIYVSDRENDRIQVFDSEGALRAVWLGLHSVDAICLGSDGYIYGGAGIDKSIIRLDRDGHLLDVWGGIPYPHGICVDRDGYIYVTEVGEGRVVKFAPAKKPSLRPRK